MSESPSSSPHPAPQPRHPQPSGQRQQPGSNPQPGQPGQPGPPWQPYNHENPPANPPQQQPGTGYPPDHPSNYPPQSPYGPPPYGPPPQGYPGAPYGGQPYYPAGPAGPRVMAEADAKTYATLMHLSALLTLIGIPSVVGPLILWLVKRDQSQRIDVQGKSAVNFHLTMLIGVLISIPLMFVYIGFITLIVIGLLAIIFPIVAAVRNSNDEYVSYPLAIEFFK